MIKVPELQFNGWCQWNVRPKPSELDDVPEDFAILGLYVLMSSETKPEPLDLHQFPATVVYIGMSAHVDRRLEHAHDAVRRYKTEHMDPSLKRLWMTVWHSDWTRMYCAASPTKLAHLAFYERALIAMYADQHDRLPELNLF